MKSRRTEMNPRTVQEVRLILWPWCLMTLAGLVPLIRPFLADKRSDWPEGIAVFGFFGGAAILTALSFRHTLRICPPALSADEGVSRRKIWSEKMAVLMVAVVCSGLIACCVQMALGTILW